LSVFFALINGPASSPLSATSGSKVRPYPSCTEQCDEISDTGDKCSSPYLAARPYGITEENAERKYSNW